MIIKIKVSSTPSILHLEAITHARDELLVRVRRQPSTRTRTHLRVEGSLAHIMVRPPGAKESNAWKWCGRMQATKGKAHCWNCLS
jgi:hypothetical protein